MRGKCNSFMLYEEGQIARQWDRQMYIKRQAWQAGRYRRLTSISTYIIHSVGPILYNRVLIRYSVLKRSTSGYSYGIRQYGMNNYTGIGRVDNPCCAPAIQQIINFIETRRRLDSEHSWQRPEVILQKGRRQLKEVLRRENQGLKVYPVDGSSVFSMTGTYFWFVLSLLSGLIF